MSKITLSLILGSYSETLKFLDNEIIDSEEISEIIQNLGFENKTDFSKCSTNQIWLKLANHPSTSPSQLLSILEHPMMSVKNKVLMNPNLPEEILSHYFEECLNFGNTNKLGTLCKNPSLSPKFIDIIIEQEWSTSLQSFKYYILTKSFKKSHFDFIEQKIRSNKFTLSDMSWLLDNNKTPSALIDKYCTHLFHYKKFYFHPNISKETRQKGLEIIKTSIPQLYKNVSEKLELHHG